MKRLSTIILALMLAALMATLLPLQVFADSTEEKYISEVKVGVGTTASEAAKALDGYEILKDDKGKNADLNRDAGENQYEKGERIVYLGYKRTSQKSEAVTDLAVMNMKGGYSVQEYEMLMEMQMKEQIIPFVESFLAAIKEYRINYTSSNAANKQRAQYIHNMLNKLTDDDCGGAGLGDLFLNETKYEMGDAAYNALSAEEKKQHADILTIIAQADGRATLMLENLLTRAADTGEDTWLERFAATDYDALMDETGLSPSKAKKQLAKLYDDDAVTVLDKWEDFRSELLNYDVYSETIKNFDEAAAEKAAEELNAIDDSTSTEEVNRRVAAYEEAQMAFAEMMTATQLVNLYDTLNTIDYADGTMLDFFLQDSADIEEDITVLYPLVAALSEGQRTGLDFISLRELLCVALSVNYGEGDKEINAAESASIYEGVDRGIYEKGGVALTSDALRADAVAKIQEDSGNPRQLINIIWMITGCLAVAAAVSGIVLYKAYMFAQTAERTYANLTYEAFDAAVTKAWRVSGFMTKMTMGLTFAAGLMAVTIGIVSAIKMKEYYKVDFSPIPRYMVDEKDLIGYNARGEKIVLKNQAAYYKAVTTNRQKSDYKYDEIGNLADLNGAIGRQWLALYAERNENREPILADSFKVTNKEEVPAGYEAGIHAFGSEAAENLNNPLYVWKSDATKIFVYFKTEAASISTAGANFSAGTLALTGGAGIAVGALVTALGIKLAEKRKKKLAQPANG